MTNTEKKPDWIKEAAIKPGGIISIEVTGRLQARFVPSLECQVACRQAPTENRSAVKGIGALF